MMKQEDPAQCQLTAPRVHLCLYLVRRALTTRSNNKPSALNVPLATIVRREYQAMTHTDAQQDIIVQMVRN